MAAALTHARRGALFGVLAALLLVNPLYVGFVVEEPRSRSSTGYAATAVDPTNASDQRMLIDHLGDDEILHVDEVSSAGQYDPYGPRYLVLDETADVLRAARGGSTSTTNQTVAFTIRRFAATHRFVAFGEHGSEQFYDFAVEDDDDTTVVTLSPVEQATVAWHVVYSDTRLYTSLPGYQRDTVDAVIESDQTGYRPYQDEFADVTDDLIRKDDTFYLFRPTVAVDDFGPSTREAASILLSLLGTLALLAAVVSTAFAYRAPSDSD